MIDIYHTIRCDYCGREVKERWNYRIGEPAPIPNIPLDWVCIAGVLYCNRHMVRHEVFVTPRVEESCKK